MKFGQTNLREIDLFDFMSFLDLGLFKFYGLLYATFPIQNISVQDVCNLFFTDVRGCSQIT